MRVRISPGALSSYLNWRAGSALPDGTWVVAEHLARQDNELGPYYFAHKTAQGWQFGASSPEGLLLAPAEGCVLCHKDAPADEIFGPGSVPTNSTEVQRPDGG